MNVNLTPDDSSSGANDDSLDAFERQLRSLIPRSAHCDAPQQLPANALDRPPVPQLSLSAHGLQAAASLTATNFEPTGPRDRDDRRSLSGRLAMLLAVWSLGAAAGVGGTLAWTGYWNNTETQPTLVQANRINPTRPSDTIEPQSDIDEQPLHSVEHSVEHSASQTVTQETGAVEQETIQQAETTARQRLVALFPWRQLQRIDAGAILTPGSRSIVDAFAKPMHFRESPVSLDPTQIREPNSTRPRPTTDVPAIISPRAVDMALPASQHKLRRDLLSDERMIF